MGCFSRLVGKLNDRIFLDNDIQRLEVTIEVYKKQLVNMEARLADLRQRKDKNSLVRK